MDSANVVPSSRREWIKYFLLLGTLGFGGPIALAGYMQRDLVERRSWISKQDYVEGLALAQLSPGPLAAQLAMYLGWVRGGASGAALIGAAFVLPSFFMVIGLALLYIRFGGLPWMQGIFYGVGAAVIAIIARSTTKLARLTLARDSLLWALFGVTAMVTAIAESEVVWLFIASGALAMLLKAPPRSWRGKTAGMVPPLFLTGIHGVASSGTLGQLAWFFTKAGTFVFGSGLAIVPFLYKGVVHDFHWLDDRQFRDAVAVAMITPGPVVITSGFIGYLVAGVYGAVVAAAGTFVPPYLVVVLGARHMRKAAANPSLKAFIGGVTASATGAIAGAAFILGRRALVDVVTAGIALATLVALFKVKKLPEPVLIVIAGVIGLALTRP
jgi:chromate transporter